jgi:hypothetical protein
MAGASRKGLRWWLTNLSPLRVAAGVAIAFLVLWWLVLPGINGGPPPPTSTCKNNLKQFGVALMGYHETHGHFPPAYFTDENGKLLYSWRVAILPYLDLAALHREFDRSLPWNAPRNQTVSRTDLTVFKCPAQPAENSEYGLTNYLAVVGPNCAWRGAKPVNLEELKEPGGDLSKIILVVEVANANVPWAKPQDLEFEKLRDGKDAFDGQSVSSFHNRGTFDFSRRFSGANVLFANGHVAWLPATTSPAELRRMLAVRGKDD